MPTSHWLIVIALSLGCFIAGGWLLLHPAQVKIDVSCPKMRKDRTVTVPCVDSPSCRQWALNRFENCGVIVLGGCLKVDEKWPRATTFSAPDRCAAVLY